MILTHTRSVFAPKYTFGSLAVDEAFECYGLEDQVRPEGAPKVPHETAIPYGSYRLAWDDSTRFKRKMLHVLDVPGFSGIRIHSGNTTADTSGCLLVGKTRYGTGSLGRSHEALLDLEHKVVPVIESGEEVWLHIVKATEGVAP